MTREEVIRKLLQEDKEFKHYYEKHDELNKLVDRLERHKPMTHELELEIEKLKKEKLYYKDLMEKKIQEYLKKVH
ncbi:MAG: DUF465 domain-containing protein [Hydrogenobacter sp.]